MRSVPRYVWPAHLSCPERPCCDTPVVCRDSDRRWYYSFSSLMAGALPSKIGKYDVLAELGVGGFGRVYKAYDPHMGREVAIKELATASDPEIMGRFADEAKAL